MEKCCSKCKILKDISFAVKYGESAEYIGNLEKAYKYDIHNKEL